MPSSLQHLPTQPTNNKTIFHPTLTTAFYTGRTKHPQNIPMDILFKAYFLWITKTAHGNGNTSFNMEKLTKLKSYRRVTKLDKQKQSLLELIGGNFEIMKKIKDIKSEANEF